MGSGLRDLPLNRADCSIRDSAPRYVSLMLDKDIPLIIFTLAIAGIGLFLLAKFGG